MVFKDSYPHMMTLASMAPQFKFHTCVDLILPNDVFRITGSLLGIQNEIAAVSGELLEEVATSHVWLFKVYKRSEEVQQSAVIKELTNPDSSKRPTLKCGQMCILKTSCKNILLLWVVDFKPGTSSSEV